MRRMRAQPLLRQSVPSHTMPSWGPEIYEARYTRPRGNTLKVAGVSFLLCFGSWPMEKLECLFMFS